MYTNSLSTYVSIPFINNNEVKCYACAMKIKCTTTHFNATMTLLYERAYVDNINKPHVASLRFILPLDSNNILNYIFSTSELLRFMLFDQINSFPQVFLFSFIVLFLDILYRSVIHHFHHHNFLFV